MIFLGLKKADFRLNIKNFYLNNPNNIVRMACGLFLLPECYGKYIGFLELNPSTIKFFSQVGFNPAEFWVYLASFGELGFGICLFLGICTRYAAIGTIFVLATACISLNIVRGGFAWTWSLGGDEYLIFWIISCISIIVYEYNRLNIMEIKN